MHKRILDLFDKTYDLIYIDYQDNLNGSMPAIQKSIQTQDWCPLYESIDEWLMESRWQGEDYAIKELTESIAREFDVELDKADSFVENHIDEIREIINERDRSDPLRDLLRNTTEPIFFYDTGEEVNFDVPFGTDKDLKECLHQIKRALHIKIRDSRWDDVLEMMIQQGYSGRLVVFFKADITNLMTIAQYKNNKIQFKNPMIAIINTWNGSGDHTDLPGHEFMLDLDTENIFIDSKDTIHYSYTHDVCGMVSSWCDCTDMHLKKTRVPKVKDIKPSSLSTENAQEDKYNATYKAGGCTPGDMDMKRHRNTFYVNDFPCGTHCPTCKTFWID